MKRVLTKTGKRENTSLNIKYYNTNQALTNFPRCGFQKPKLKWTSWLQIRKNWFLVFHVFFDSNAADCNPMIQNPSDLTLSITKKKVHFLNFKSSPILIQLLSKEGITTSILKVIQVFFVSLYWKQNKLHHQKITVSIFYRFSFCGFRPRSKAATHKRGECTQNYFPSFKETR